MKERPSSPGRKILYITLWEVTRVIIIPGLLQSTCDHISEYLYTGKGGNSNISGTLGHRALLNIDNSRLEVSSWFPIRRMVYAGQVIIRVFRSMLIICTVPDYIRGNA